MPNLKNHPQPDSSAGLSPIGRLTATSSPQIGLRHRSPAYKLWQQRILHGIKTFAWVAPLTILIWVYAEREQLVPKSDVTVPIEITTDAPDRVITVVPPQDKNIVVALSGPQSGVDRVVSYCRTEASQKPLRIFVPRDELPLNNPRVSIPITDRLANDDLFRHNAVTVTKCFPTYFMVSVEKLIKVRLPVELPPDTHQTAGFKISGEQGRPLEVDVSGPESILTDTPAKPRLKIYAELDGFKSRKGHFEADVPLKLSAPADHVTFPPTIKGFVDATETQTYELGSIPVYILAARPVLEQYRIECTPAVQNVSVAGPPQSIDLLKPKADSAAPPTSTASTSIDTTEPFIAYAVLRINNTDLRGDDQQKVRILTPEDYHLPKDVVLTGEPKEIRFRLIPRPHDAEP